ncbi:hypothetical protein AVEN_135021-1 [Araneus ventricosus]|uniref:Uncharacterized protein n=1 Tax=Araneus ventricosus TaxID=182803 RepID=A0A4Y2G9M6_ARAVE|nr:hypothetical protein AVEN_135021-1 [Araneus ventricosus]
MSGARSILSFFSPAPVLITGLVRANDSRGMTDATAPCPPFARPLCLQSADPTDLHPLTTGNCLAGTSLLFSPEQNTAVSSLSLTSRWSLHDESLSLNKCEGWLLKEDQ